MSEHDQPDTLRARLRAEGMAPDSWGNRPFDTYAPHEHAYDKVLVCVRGGITFGLPDRGEAVTLGPGDRLDLPAGTRHDAHVGPQGVTCLEAHLAAGKVALAHRRAGTW
jgi:uncharacterized protein YjlB